MKCEVEIDVEIPDGYKIVRIGAPKKGELYIDDCVHKTVIKSESDLCYITCVIVAKCSKWREATSQEILQKLLQPEMHVIRIKDRKEIRSVESITRQYVYVLDSGDYIQQLHWDDLEILEEPS